MANLSSRMRSTYLSIEEIAPKMVLAKPLAVTEKRMLRYALTIARFWG